jgi:hypothetical protein
MERSFQNFVGIPHADTITLTRIGRTIEALQSEQGRNCLAAGLEPRKMSSYHYQ